MIRPARADRKLFLLSIAVGAAILLFDLSVPLGVAGGVPYVALVMIGLWLPGQRYPVALAVVATVLTVVGYIYSPSGGVPWIVLTNRVLAFFAIWTTAILIAYRMKAEESAKSLNLQVVELRDLRERSDEQAAHAVSLAEDLTVARDEAEKATRRATIEELHIRSILNTVNDAIITLNADGLIESFNMAAVTIFGHKQEDVIGRNVSILMPEPHRSKHDQYIKSYIEGRPARILGETVELVAR